MKLCPQCLEWRYDSVPSCPCGEKAAKDFILKEKTLKSNLSAEISCIPSAPPLYSSCRDSLLRLEVAAKMHGKYIAEATSALAARKFQLFDLYIHLAKDVFSSLCLNHTNTTMK